MFAHYALVRVPVGHLSVYTVGHSSSLIDSKYGFLLGPTAPAGNKCMASLLGENDGYPGRLLTSWEAMMILL
jgi:hypothetical protein